MLASHGGSVSRVLTSFSVLSSHKCCTPTKPCDSTAYVEILVLPFINAKASDKKPSCQYLQFPQPETELITETSSHGKHFLHFLSLNKFREKKMSNEATKP